jgi:hypothetical protein
MDVERRGGQSKMGDFGQLGNQEEPHDLNRKRLFSQGNNLIAMKSRVRRESQARFCERLVVKFHRPTRQPLTLFETPVVSISTFSVPCNQLSAKSQRKLFQMRLPLL